MNYVKERRELKRFNIPGARIKYTQEAGFQNSMGYSGNGKLIDISIKGVRFETEHDLSVGAIINLELIISNRPVIKLAGYVLWVIAGNENVLSQAVVQFYTFGEGKEYNSIESMNALEELTNEFVQ